MTKARTLADLAAHIRATHPEVIASGPKRRRGARPRWDPLFLRVYGVRPWEMGRFTHGEINRLVESLNEYGLG